MNDTQKNKDIERWDSAQQEDKDALVLVLSSQIHYRFQRNVMYNVRVTDVNKRINTYVIMVLILNKVKRRVKRQIRGFDVMVLKISTSETREENEYKCYDS